MENSFMENLTNAANYKLTENGGVAHKSTRSMVYDLFALGGAYRQRSDEDCILLFKNAFEEDETLALKCLFYLRDCRGGQGERRFFRVCFKWLANNYPEAARRNLEFFGYDKDIITPMDMHEVKEKYDVAIIDLPYGLFTPISGDEQRKLIMSARKMADKLILVVFEDMKEIIEESGFKIIDSANVNKGKFVRTIHICV